MTRSNFQKPPITGIFHHVGLVVRDVDKTADFYESLGVGPFEPLVFGVKNRKLRGAPLSGLKLKIRMAHTGPTRIELIQPIDGIGPWFDFLAHHGEGATHIGYVVNDIDESKKELVKRGLKIIYEGWFENGSAAAYVESEKLGGIIFEIFQRPSNYVPREKTRIIEEVAAR
ncbi:VOC family protein [Chloroflexota bacterium]